MLKTVLVVFLGIALVVAGTAIATYGGFTLSTAQRQLLQVGPLRAGTQQSSWYVAIPPIVGGILLVGGTILILAGALRRRGPKPGETTESGREAPVHSGSRTDAKAEADAHKSRV